jgi:hypothetical protein
MPYHWHAFATPDVDTTCHLEVYMHTLASMMLLKCLIKSSVNMIEKPPTPTLILLCPGNSCSGRRIRQVICRACPQGPGAVDPADLIEATKLHAALRELDSARLNMCVSAYGFEKNDPSFCRRTKEGWSSRYGGCDSGCP